MSKVEYNQLSKEFKEKTGWGTPLGRDEVVQFQIINIPVIKQNNEMLPFYAPKWIPSTDMVYDPGAETMVPIAYVVGRNANEKDPYRFGQIVFTKEDKNVITITGRDTNKMDLLYYLRACNFNQSNPFAKPGSQGFIFKELEPVKSAKQRLKEKEELAMCTTYILEMKESDVIATMKVLKLPIYTSADENRAYLVDFVQEKTNRSKFNSVSKDARMPVAALIETAVAKEIIRYEKDPMTWILVDTRKEITQVVPQTDPMEHLIDYFHNNNHGRSIKDYVQKQLEVMSAEKSLEVAGKELDKEDKKKK
jgi:hypothetical protein